MTAADPMPAVRAYIDAFNAGDAQAMSSMFTAQGSILDGMAPHVWLGSTAASDWYRDVLTEGRRHGASDYAVALGEPVHNAVSGESAYVVVPATMTFNLEGTQVTQTGSFFTVALREVDDGWRIAAWAWTKGKQQ
jgi:ketosteroid isomerase-like protein